ncbi:MAG: FG-GAP-like repeat-containing protein [Myxococcota bacterium]
MHSLPAKPVLPVPPQARRGARLLAGTVAVATLCGGGAFAQWPPPRDATVEQLATPEFWPNDPGYAFCPSPSPTCAEGDERDGQWTHYSFVPPQRGARLRPAETASGMSIDRAWRYTTGSPRVLIAVTDSGIEWDEPDLLDRHFLNLAELANYVPTGPMGEPCGGEGDLAGYDCFPVGAPDGVLTVSDFQFSDALLAPAADGEHPLGDANRNGVLDPEDLILNFSDGIDDDGNGYVDDISGWDFAKDDNNPYDDTRYGHGTGEAKDSAAEANNGLGTAGNCPRCRVVSLRVGDSFITDVNAFGQAVVYATDLGARVIQCALGTVNMNTFAQQALDYAYAQGALTVTSMADENSRHHNVPATANHTLPVHAIHYRPDDYRDVDTWLAFNPCTNFGGQNMLSVSGEACSSEAVGQLSGIAGLLYAAAETLSPPLSPPLSPAEAMQLLLTTAEDIDIPESREPGQQTFHWSQPGFDQRFGYGRVDANATVEALRAGRIPPAIDLLRPTWFQVLYPQRRRGPVAIEGHITTRAPSYDYTVAWAPGVQPPEEAFIEVAREENVPNETVAGAEAPLAQLDVRTVDPTHTWDVDSPLGENRFTITVRVRAVARYGGDIGEVTGELRRTYYVHEDPDLRPGFPVDLEASGEASPKMADVDGDGIDDLIVAASDGRIHVWSLAGDGDPVAVEGFPFVGPPVDGLAPDAEVRGKPSYLGGAGYDATSPDALGASVDPRRAGSAFINAPAVADLDDDGHVEIVATTWNGFVFVIEHDGTVKTGFPVRLPEVPSCPAAGAEDEDRPCTDPAHVIDRGAYAAPVLVDMNADGRLDITQAAFDGRIHVFDARTGASVSGWPVEVTYDGPLSAAPRRGRIVTTPAAGDFDGDGRPELLVGSNEQLGDGGDFGAYYLVDGRGMAAGGAAPWRDGWPVTVASQEVLPLVGEGTTNAGAIGRFGDQLRAVVYGNGSLPRLLPDAPGPQERLDGPVPGQGPAELAPLSRFGPLSTARDDVMLPLFSVPALGDIDQDGTLDVVASGSSLSLANSVAGTALRGQHLVHVWSGATGEPLPAAPFVIEDYSFFNSQAIADLDGDDYPEVIAGSGGYVLHAWNGCGAEPEGWPKFTGQWILATPAVGDVDGDGLLEVAVTTRSGWLYVWDTPGSADGVVPWPSKHHDLRNTGNAETRERNAEPTTAPRAAVPLTAALCDASSNPPPPPRLTPAGGCGCRVVPGGGGDGGVASTAAGPDRRRVVAAWVICSIALIWGRRRSAGRRRRRGRPSRRRAMHHGDHEQRL